MSENESNASAPAEADSKLYFIGGFPDGINAESYDSGRNSGGLLYSGELSTILRPTHVVNAYMGMMKEVEEKLSAPQKEDAVDMHWYFEIKALPIAVHKRRSLNVFWSGTNDQAALRIDLPISQLDIPQRVQTALEKAGINSIRQLLTPKT